MSRILFHVQHLFGIGHLQRIGVIAEATAARGIETTIVTGGRPVPGFAPPGVRVCQLPPLKAGPGGFRDLRDGEGRKATPAYLEARRDRLWHVLAQTRPHILVIESFPFARWPLAFELEPFIEAARRLRPRPLLVSSIRDILEPSTKPGRAARVCALVETAFDAVLVHGDPTLVRLEETFPEAHRIAHRLHYTGIVAAPAPASPPPGADEGGGEILVSAGGGPQGVRLMRAALAIAKTPIAPACACSWRLLPGLGLPERDIAALAADAPPHVTVERFRPDFRRLLAHARLSISYAGYNTAADILRARRAAVMVARTGGEREQALRAERFEERGLAIALTDEALSPERLRSAMARALARPLRPHGLDLDGARKSGALLESWLRGEGPGSGSRGVMPRDGA